VKTIDRCRKMEEACRRHAELDETTAAHWLELAEVWSKLEKVEHRLQQLGAVQRPCSAKSNQKNETVAGQ
jgi:hypothetical protein